MRFTLPTNKTTSEKGFTLIEMLIIAPVVILAIGGFIGLIVSMVGDVLLTRDGNSLAFNTQRALDRIEQDVRLGTQFLTTTDTLTAPQGSNNNFTGTAAFTNSTANTFIMSAVTTDENPTSSSRWLVYYANQPNPCGSKQSYNRIFLMKVIYFVKDGSLWRRSVLPDYNTNTGTPDANTVCAFYDYVYQRDSCSPGYASNTRCQTNDELVMENVENLNVEYFAKPDDTSTISASQAKLAKTVKITINSKKTTAGEDFTFSGSVRATRLNNIDSTLPPPATPNLSYTLDGPASAKFAWTHVPTANSYEISYNVNGGAWTNQSLNANTRTFTVPDTSHEDTITFKVAAKNVSGSSAEAELTATLPFWTLPTLQNNWEAYGGIHSQPAFRRTSAGLIKLKGIVRYGTNGDSVVFTLPSGYRPTTQLTFFTEASGGIARLDIRTNGEIRLISTTTAWVSLDHIAFLPDSSGWTNLTLQNSWTNSSPVLRVKKDTEGRAHLQGFITPGTLTNELTIANLPASGYSSPLRQLIPVAHGTFAHFGIYDDGTDRVVIRTPASGGFHAPQHIFYPATTGWTNLTLQGGWLNYGGTFATAQYRKFSDGLVMVKGLIKSGSVTNNSVLATLPVGFRPKEQLIFPSVTNPGVNARVDVQADGDIVVKEWANAGWYSLDTIMFMAEQ